MDARTETRTRSPWAPMPGSPPSSVGTASPPPADEDDGLPLHAEWLFAIPMTGRALSARIAFREMR